jgi:hypothetical protein
MARKVAARSAGRQIPAEVRTWITFELPILTEIQFGLLLRMRSRFS